MAKKKLQFLVTEDMFNQFEAICRPASLPLQSRRFSIAYSLSSWPISEGGFAYENFFYPGFVLVPNLHAESEQFFAE